MSSDKPISYKPTDGLCYDPAEELYWDEGALYKEMTRVFELCHSCRMCFKYCDAFPRLFEFVDQYEGDVTKLTKEQIKSIMDDCFQCKLCEVQCPYTQRDAHEYRLDFPKLAHRYRAILRKKQGGKFQNKLLANVDTLGRLFRLSLGLANVMNRVAIHRFFLEKIIGVHRKKNLPDFARKTFDSWAKKANKIKEPKDEPEVVLFPTCYVKNNEPDIGKDTIAVLEKNQVSVACVEGLKCCGMPYWEHGDLGTLRKNGKHNIDILLPYIKKGAKILSINPTCGMMMRREYIDLLDKEDRGDAKKIAEAVMDPGEFLWSIRDQERFNTDFKSSPGESVGYHAPCHLRVQSVGFKGRDLLRKIPGVNPKLVLQCCGHNGTYAMKKDSFEKSIRIGEKAFSEMKNSESDVWATECPLAATQFEQHAGKKPLHPMSILARAYRPDGFPNKIGKSI